MRRIVAVLTIVLLGCTFAVPAAVIHVGTADAVTCGVERWPVKTLSDSDAGAVNFAPAAATVAELRVLAAPGSLPAASRIVPTELTTYAVTANVVKFKLEDDRDVHVVISDLNDPTQTMIVEFPDAVSARRWSAMDQPTTRRP